MNTDKKDYSKLYITIIVFVVIAIYGQSIFFDFLEYDDKMYVINNTYINGSTDSSFFDYFIPGHIRQDIYMPVTCLLYRFLYIIAGPSSAIFHIVNIVFYLASCILFFSLISKILSNIRKAPIFPISSKAERYMSLSVFNGNMPSLLISLIYACIPLHVEYVSWISAMGYNIASTFFFAAFILFIDILDKFKIQKFIYFLILSFISIFSQPSSAVLPLILILWAVCFRKKDIKNAIIISLFPFIISASYAILTKLTIKSARDGDFTILEKIATFGRYIFNLLFPYDLMISYFNCKGPAIESIYIIFALPALLSIIFIIKRNSIGTFCTLFFFISYLPYMNIIYTLNLLMQDRYMMFPSCAWAIGIIFLFTIIATNFKNIKILKYCTIIVLLFYIFCSLIYIPIWKNTGTLFLYQYAKNPNDKETTASYGFLLKDKGKYQEAIEMGDRLIKDFPDFIKGYNLKMISLEEIGRSEDVIKECDALLKKNPDFFYLLPLKASAKYRIGMYAEAYSDMKTFMEKALKEKTLKIDAHIASSMFFKVSYMECKNKDMEMCIKWLLKKNEFNEAESVIKSNDEKRFIEYLSSSKSEIGKQYLSKILHVKRLKKIYGDKAGEILQKNMIMMKKSDVMIKNRNYEEAEKIYLEAIKSDPFMVEALCRLAYMMVQKNNFKEAEKYVSEAIKLDPSSKIAKELRDNLLRQKHEQK